MPDIDDEDKPLDPRAGKVHVDLHQIKFDPLKIADMLEELCFHQNTTTKSRNVLKKLASK